VLGPDEVLLSLQAESRKSEANNVVKIRTGNSVTIVNVVYNFVAIYKDVKLRANIFEYPVIEKPQNLAKWRIFPAIWLIVLSEFAGGAAMASETAVCAPELRDIILTRDFGLAYFCAAERLESNPADVEAQLIFARAAQEIGQWDVAMDYADRARQTSLSTSDRFASYLISGMAAAGQGAFLKAKLHLHRGVDLAQTEAEERIIAQAMGQIRAHSPWSFGVNFNVNPSTNINGGSANDTITFLGLQFPLDADAQAQAGIGYSLNVNATHRRRISDRMIWENRVSFDGTVYDGRGRNDLKLGVKSSLRYSPDTTSLWVGYIGYEQRYLGVELGGDAFGEYYAYTNQTSVGLEYYWQPRPAHFLSGYAVYTSQNSDVSPVLGAVISKVGGSYGFPVFAGGALTVAAFVEDVDNNIAAAAVVNTMVSVSGAWQLEALPIGLSGKLEYTRAEYKFLSFGYSDIRVDDVVSLELGITPENLQWMGFQPTFGVRYTHGFSNLDRFETDEVKVFTRLSSVF